jgi:triacylglycerol lipase
VDPLLAVTEAFVGGAFNAHPNDGLVRAEDARFGVFLGCIPADHFDEIGHLVGDRPGLGNDFDHLVFYRELVRWIRARGL